MLASEASSAGRNMRLRQCMKYGDGKSAVSCCAMRASPPHLYKWSVRRARSCSVSATKTPTGPPELASWPPMEVWEEFSNFHVGCWESRSAKFSPSGEILPLPDKYVPENFKEWGRTMHEWQSLCDASADGRALSQKLRRMWPVSGCEYGKEDVALEESHKLFAAAPDGAPTPCRALVAEGHYTDGPARLPSGPGSVRIEQCIATQDPAARIRVVYDLAGALEPWAGGGPLHGQPLLRWRLAGAELFLEQRRHADSEMDGFSAEPRLAKEAFLEGVSEPWGSKSGALLALMGGKVKVSPWWSLDPKPQWALASRAALTGGELLLLPIGAWAYVEQASPQTLIVESGIYWAADERSVVSCSYTDGALDSAVFGEDRIGSGAPAQAPVGYSGKPATAEEVALEEEILRELELDQDDDSKGRPAQPPPPQAQQVPKRIRDAFGER